MREWKELCDTLLHHNKFIIIQGWWIQKEKERESNKERGEKRSINKQLTKFLFQKGYYTENWVNRSGEKKEENFYNTWIYFGILQSFPYLPLSFNQAITSCTANMFRTDETSNNITNAKCCNRDGKILSLLGVVLYINLASGHTNTHANKQERKRGVKFMFRVGESHGRERERERGGIVVLMAGL